MKKKIIIGSVIIIIASIVIVSMSHSSKSVQFNTAIVHEETVETSVTATGYVQPVDQVEVGTQVSGVIEKIFVDYNSQVSKGQLLAELDKSTLSEKLAQSKATLLSAVSDSTYARLNYNRISQLYEAKAATEASYEEALNRLMQAKTTVDNAKANVHQAEVNLSYAEIYSPIDGVVLDRSVEQGQTVAASFSTPTLFTIANDLKNMQVEADVDEADIGNVRLDQEVRFSVDAYPDDMFAGTVRQIRLQPTVTNNVVTYTVIIDAPNPDEKLFPGMTASVTIVTRSEKGIVVPIEALNFQPSPEVMEKMNTTAPAEMGPRNKGVWLQTPDGAKRANLETGLSDGVYAIVKQGLNTGDTIILSASLEKKKQAQESAAANPLMPKPPGKRR